MVALVAVLWAVYLSECFVRVRPGDWIFRPGLSGGMRGVSEPDAQFVGGRVAFSWTALLPWSAAYVVSGPRLTPSGIGGTVAQLARARRLLTVVASVLFALILLAFPALILTNTLLPALPILILSIALAWLSTFTAFLITYRRMHKTPPPMETWLTQALSPLSLIRSPLVASVRSIADAHPVAAAAALCDDDEFLRIARLWHYDAESHRAAIDQLARARGVLDELHAPPASPDAGATGFCPRCHATYLAQRTECRDCDDVLLLPLVRH